VIPRRKQERKKLLDDEGKRTGREYWRASSGEGDFSAVENGGGEGKGQLSALWDR